ncbi:hypothetical protein PS016_23590, partial [Shigella sonnei]|nr:hypothetical protein [Shigella sonnei]
MKAKRKKYKLYKLYKFIFNLGPICFKFEFIYFNDPKEVTLTPYTHYSFHFRDQSDKISRDPVVPRWELQVPVTVKRLLDKGGVAGAGS